MRNTALVLGLIGGILGMVIGFFYYGAALASEWWDDYTVPLAEAGVDPVQLLEDPRLAKIIAIGGPILAIAGAALSPSRPWLGAIFLGLATGGMIHGFTVNLFTVFPIFATGLAAMFALLGAVLPPKPAHH